MDNGPAEQPASVLVQMCAVRLVAFLHLDKLTQISFAEYHSKRNFVERAHAAENEALSRHGPYSSNTPNPKARIGSVQHKENMEHMAAEVQHTLRGATFGKKYLQSYRGIKLEDYVFNDEPDLKAYLDLTEDKKALCPSSKYQPIKNHVFYELVQIWGVDENFAGSYKDDYDMLRNKSTPVKTSWLDKYTTCVYSSDINSKVARCEKQPVPDYLRWFNTTELHNLPYEDRITLSEGVWDETPGLFIPSNILDLAVSVIPFPPDDVVDLIGLVAWVPPKEVREYYNKSSEEQNRVIGNDIKREQWKNHKLYKEKSKHELEVLCKEMRIPVNAGLNKHELVQLISDSKGEDPPAEIQLYSGDVHSIPSSTVAISKLPVAMLRSVLYHHGFHTHGSKDELVIRVFLVKHQRTSAMFAREKQLRSFIKVVLELIHCQRMLHAVTTCHLYRKRQHSACKITTSCINKPTHIELESDLKALFDPLLTFIDGIASHRRESDSKEPQQVRLTELANPVDDTDQVKEQIKQVGARIKVKWTNEELGDSGWKPGWYLADVQHYHEDEDQITITYPSEPGCTYTIELTPSLHAKNIKLVRAVL